MNGSAGLRPGAFLSSALLGAGRDTGHIRVPEERACPELVEGRSEEAAFRSTPGRPVGDARPLRGLRTALPGPAISKAAVGRV